MDDSTPQARDRAAPQVQPTGGTVEPTRRPRVQDPQPTQQPPSGERYELRDPYAEVTYRPATLSDVVAKANQLGITRFTAIDTEGNRTPVTKVDDRWQRGNPLPPAPQRPIDNHPQRDETTPQPSTNTGPTRSPTAAATRETAPLPNATAEDPQAQRAAQRERLQAALQDRYVIKRAPVSVGAVTVGHTEYRFRGDTSRVAFTESTFRLATDTNSPSVARSMVDVAEARNWKALRVSGNEDFKRMVWLEATVRGVKTQGYEPSAADQELLKREREARQVNRIEPVPSSNPGNATSTPTEKASARGGSGRKAVLAAIEAVLVAKGVPEKRREAVMAAATDKLAQRIREGRAPEVKVYDRAAPSQRPIATPTPEVQRSRDRPTPAPVR